VQLDKTEIVIRQRSMSELMDLSLIVLRRHGIKIAAASALLGIPFMAANLLAINWMLAEEAVLATEDISESEVFLRWRYFFHLVALFILEFPLISLPATVLLGNQVFYEQLTWRQLLSKLRSVAWTAIWVLGVLRIGLLGLVLEYFVRRTSLFDPGPELLLMVGLGCVMLVRGIWPFAPEIIGLELCPWRVKPGFPVTYTQRRAGLHQTLSTDHFARFLGSSCVAIALGAAIAVAGYTTVSALIGRTEWSNWYLQLLVPVTLWSVGLFVVVFRFLSYLDSRIRLEGWELELRLRAEGERVTIAMAPPMPDAPANPEQVVA
jgi:hypothetical protein